MTKRDEKVMGPRSHGKTTLPDTVADMMAAVRRAALEEALAIAERRAEMHERELASIGRMPESERRSWLGSAAECHRRMAEWIADDIRALLGRRSV